MKILVLARTCKDCKEPACGDCLWINSEDFKNCQHEEVQRVLGLGQYRCPHCGLLVGADLAEFRSRVRFRDDMGGLL